MAAREAGVDMRKEEFACVINGLARPQASSKQADEHQATDN